MIRCEWMVWIEVTPSSRICWMPKAMMYMTMFISFSLSQP